ncbi:MAG: aspartate ammonia-lyase [Candidatus Nanohaloarchaea archaeon]|nr:aspartate ammonia-lyase [Candidatus Nanohaloarchaea archaeon]
MGERTEQDSMGKVEVLEEAYYGSFTSRALENFQITPEEPYREFYHALGMIKKAAAQVNREIGLLGPEKSDAIVKASEEVINGYFDDQFVLDPIQAGAGTPFHMNANEVIANRATELLGGEKGDYAVHPNDHVNMGQSSNNVIPTAVHLSALEISESLLDEIEELKKTFKKKGEEFEDVLKVGRTHLQDAVPVTLGQEFRAYSRMCKKGMERLEQSFKELREVGLGGNAVGTGINTPPEFRQNLVSRLADIAGKDIIPAEDPREATQSRSALARLSSELKVFVLDMVKVADDLIFLNSGPVAGIGELELPEVEPGSSIMPGKVNPSIVEAFKMTCIDFIGSAEAIDHAAKEGDLDLNIMAPLIAKNLFGPVKALRSSLKMLREKCVEGIEADRNRIEQLFQGSTATATALSPYIGYHRTAEVVKEALSSDKTVKEAVVDRDYLTGEEAEEILDPERMTEPSGIDQDLKQKIQDRLED